MFIDYLPIYVTAEEHKVFSSCYILKSYGLWRTPEFRQDRIFRLGIVGEVILWKEL